jgi:hypothetical protein
VPSSGLGGSSDVVVAAVELLLLVLAALYVTDALLRFFFGRLGLVVHNCNCDVLPLSLEDLLNYKTLMLKFCTNKLIWALLLRQVFFGGGKGSIFPQKRV